VPPWPETPGWAEPAVAYLDAYREALGSGDVHQIFPFLADSVRWYGGEPGGRLRTGLLDTLTGLVDAPPTVRHPGPFYATWGQARTGIWYMIDWVHTSDLPPSACPGTERCRRLQDVHLAIGPEGIAEHSVRSLVADLRGTGRTDEADLEQIEARYSEIARRLSSGDADEAAAMMSDTPVWRYTTDGSLERIDPRAQWAEQIAGIFAELPDAEIATLTTQELGLPGEARPAVFFIPGDSVVTRYGEDTIGGVGVYRQTLTPELSMIVAFEWFEQAQGIVHLELELEPHALIHWSETGEPPPMVADPSLWPQVPAAGQQLTGTIETDAGDILVYNGSDSQTALVEWALGRYATAGLPVPAPRSVAFPPSVNCVLHAGLAIDTGAGVDIQLCFDEAETCSGGECAATTDAQSTLLHELGHVWTVQYLDDATRAAFLEVRELEAWSAPGVSRDELGTEHAAEILAWALLESDTWPARLPDNDCEDLAAGYRILTGMDPPRGCP
jgi:hypothetical protein